LDINNRAQWDEDAARRNGSLNDGEIDPKRRELHELARTSFA
jgi:hypothetical protein